jgi:hypothetical protein
LKPIKLGVAGCCLCCPPFWGMQRCPPGAGRQHFFAAHFLPIGFAHWLWLAADGLTQSQPDQQWRSKSSSSSTSEQMVRPRSQSRCLLLGCFCPTGSSALAFTAGNECGGEMGEQKPAAGQASSPPAMTTADDPQKCGPLNQPTLSHLALLFGSPIWLSLLFGFILSFLPSKLAPIEIERAEYVKVGGELGLSIVWAIRRPSPGPPSSQGCPRVGQ